MGTARPSDRLLQLIRVGERGLREVHRQTDRRREAEAANPGQPSSGISIDGMVLRSGSAADVLFERRCQETRNSFSTRGVKLLVKKTDIACGRATFWGCQTRCVAAPSALLALLNK